MIALGPSFDLFRPVEDHVEQGAGLLTRAGDNQEALGIRSNREVGPTGERGLNFEEGFRCADLRSAGVTFFQGKPILLITVQHLSGHQSIHLARSDDKGQFHVEENALIGANGNSRANNPHESEGVMEVAIWATAIATIVIG